MFAKGMRVVGLVPEYLVGVLVLVIAALISVEVVGRFFLNVSIAWTEEVTRLLFVWLSFLGGAVGVKKGSHLNLSLLQDRISPRLHRALSVVSSLCVLAFGALLAVDGATFARQAFGELMTITDLSLGWQFLSVPVAGVLIVLYALVALERDIAVWLDRGVIA